MRFPFPLRLSLPSITKLQAKCGPLGLIKGRVDSDAYHSDDLLETVRAALIGAGMDSAEADALVERERGQTPLAIWHDMASSILSDFMRGYGRKPAL